MFLKSTLTELEQFIVYSDKTAGDVSKKSVGWHLDHAIKVILGTSRALEKSDPGKYKWTFSLVRTYIFTFNHIPRGKGRSPRSFISSEVIDKNDLFGQLEKVRIKLQSFENLDPNSNFKHPYFGIINLKMAKKFLKLHTVHHLKICRDIIKSDQGRLVG